MIDDFEKKVLDYCTRHEMFFPGDGVLVAFSGGGDSTGLLHVLRRLTDIYDMRIEAAHLNHSLRGDESDRDEEFCREVCARWNIRLTVLKIPEGEFARRNGSLETAAREARQAFLEHTASVRGLNRIATGHTLDDQAETLFQRILRGTGPSGLRGILPVRNNWVRPLLWATRAEIRDYLAVSGIEFHDDSTNAETEYFRNRIRHELIPYLRETFSPNVTGVLSRLAELSGVQEDYMRVQMLAAFETCCIHADSCKILLDKPAFIGYHNVLQQRMVRHCLELLEGAGRDTDMDEIENILDLIGSGTGECDITAGIHCEAGNRTVAFVMPVDTYEPVPVKIPGETVIPGDGGLIIAEKISERRAVDGRVSVLVSESVTEKYGNLTVGLVKRGESITPFGMHRPVKIRDIMSSLSLPKVLRDTMPVVRAGALPVWIPGMKSSEYLRVREAGSLTGKERESVILRFKDGLQWPHETRVFEQPAKS